MVCSSLEWVYSRAQRTRTAERERASERGRARATAVADGTYQHIIVFADFVHLSFEVEHNEVVGLLWVAEKHLQIMDLFADSVGVGQFRADGLKRAFVTREVIEQTRFH